MKRKVLAVIVAVVCVVALARPGTYGFLLHTAWPLIRGWMLAWDGPTETIVTSNGTTVVLQYEKGDAGAEMVRAAVDEAVNAASYWGTVPFPVTVRLERNSAALQIIRGDFAMQVGGRAFGDLILIRSPDREDAGKNTARDFGVTLAHEFAHIVMQERTGNYGGGIQTAPSWFVEGAARYAAGEAHWTDDIRIGRRSDIDTSRFVNDWYLFYTVDPNRAYEASGSLFTHLYEDEGRAAMESFLADLRNGMSFESAFQARYGMTAKAFVERWWAETQRSEYLDDLQPYDAAFKECPKEPPGVCLTMYEFRVFSTMTVTHSDGTVERDPVEFAAWANDCRCMDDGPWLSDFANDELASDPM